MTKGTIDRASAVMVPVFLTYRRPQDADAWARDCALGFTLISLFTDHIAFSPNPTRDQSISGLWGEFVSGLSTYAKLETRPMPSTEARALASAYAISSTPGLITSALISAKSDPSFQAWVEWHAKYQLVEHSARLNGLFDFQFLVQLADILNTSPSEVKRLWDRSRDPGAVELLCRRLLNGTLTGEDESIIEAWLASMLMRGTYHDELARIRNRQNYRHPMRSFVHSQENATKHGTFYRPSPAEKYFASILLGIAVKADRSPSRRIRLYNQNAEAARQAWNDGTLILQRKGESEAQLPITDESGLGRAAREVSWMIRNGVLDVGGAKATTAFEIAGELSSAAIGFALTPWAGLAVGAVSGVTFATLHPARRITVAKAANPRELARLGRAVAGPIDVVG
jgi:hypothetical protein